METSDLEVTQTLSPPPAAQPTPETETGTAAKAEPPFEHCDTCGAPVDTDQRYCVSCGTRRRHVNDPAARFLSSATSARRRGARPAAVTRQRPASGLGLALLLAVIPLAVGLGVLVGRASNNGDGKLIAALKAQKPVAAASGAATGAAATAGGGTAGGGTQVAALKSTFPLQSGYAVELQTIARKSTTASAVAAAESAAKAKGATSVGLILLSDFRVSPAPPGGAEVIYSGAYHSSADAAKALTKLKKNFPGAKVISVKSASLAAGAGKVLTKTNYGTAHQITGFKATPADLAQGRQVVNRVAHQIGKSYVGAQKNLPDQISVP
jgi:hypothetical protein